MPQPRPVALVGDLLATQAKAARRRGASWSTRRSATSTSWPSWACRSGRAGSASRAPTKDGVGRDRRAGDRGRRDDPARATSSCSTPTARRWSRPSASRRCSRPRSSASERERVKRAKLQAGELSYDLDGLRAGSRARPRSRSDIAHLGPVELLDADRRREPALLHRPVRHGDRGARGPVGLPARLGRLPALQPGADRGRSSRHGLIAICARASPEALERRVAAVEQPGSARAGTRGTAGAAPPTGSATPTGTRSSSTTRASATSRRSTCGRRSRTQPQRYIGRGAAVKRLDHVNLLAADVRANREFCQRAARLPPVRADRQLDDGSRGRRLDERVTIAAHELIYTRRPRRRPRAPAPPRLLGRHARGAACAPPTSSSTPTSRSRRRRPSTRSPRASSSTASSRAATASR